ncbi:transposon Ty3-G Gag-Pol polyprotein [Trichonephila clavipes]|nr:transposon Ty3-G Gag-Pol polyprotein [Trichonephila clavipes]
MKPIGIALKNFKTEKVKLLYKLICEDDEEFTRKRLRNFCGFTFLRDSEEFTIKLKDIQKKFSYNEIVTISNIFNISIEGNKSELCKRILSLLTNLNELLLMASSGANESDSENGTNDSSMQADSMGKNLDLEINKMHVDNGSQNKIIYVNSNVNVNYSDIEYTISKFNAEPHENINNWIKHFENIAELFCLLQKFVFGKRSLGGIAKLFIQTELKINSWEKLKQSLIDEFSLEINSALLHELLRNRKIRDCETASEYFLKMKELCNSGKIDDSALMYYVIKGINGRQENKIILYGCNNLTQFKEKLKIYDAIKNDYVKCRGNFDKIKPRYDFNRYNSCDKMKTKHDEKCNFRKDVVSKNKMRYDNNNTGYESYKRKVCFNCGDPNHISRNCMYKNEGIKCFRCEVFGHKASECPDNNDTKLDVAHLIINKEETLTKKLLIGGLILDALIDSRVTLMQKSVYDKINHVQLFPLNTTLRGFSNSKVRVFGYFKDDIQIERER